jgi:hypothetical protein
LESCPTCEATALVITEIRCERCATEVRSQYRPTIFSRLSDENLRFLEIFVRNRGNVKEMERELNVSYWTIRSRLDEVIEALGFGEEAPTGAHVGQDAAQQTILDRLEAGEISVDEAAELLDTLGSG